MRISRSRVSGCLVAATLFATLFLRPVMAWAQRASAKPVPMARYSDPEGDVSFEYPVVWKLDNANKFYLAPHLLQGDVLPRAQVIFSPAANYYAKTNLLGLDFVYVKAQMPAAETCAQRAVGDIPAKVETVEINGVSFQHFDLGDAGMCHGIDQHVYWTYRGESCYLFEGDMHTTCAGVYPGQRELTETEKRALNRHLKAIPFSIIFANSK